MSSISADALLRQLLEEVALLGVAPAIQEEWADHTRVPAEEIALQF
jgi:hypothetical protein